MSFNQAFDGYSPLAYLSTEQMYGTNLFIIYRKLPVPVQMIFINHMQHPVAALLNPKKNKTLASKNFQDSDTSIVQLNSWAHSFHIDVDTYYIIPRSWYIKAIPSFLYWQIPVTFTNKKHKFYGKNYNSESLFCSSAEYKINDSKYRKNVCSKALCDCCFTPDDIIALYKRWEWMDYYYMVHLVQEKLVKGRIDCSCKGRIDSSCTKKEYKLFKKYEGNYPFNLGCIDAHLQKDMELLYSENPTHPYITYPGDYDSSTFDIYNLNNYGPRIK